MNNATFCYERSDLKPLIGLTDQKFPIFYLLPSQISDGKRTIFVYGRFRFELVSVTKPPSFIARLAKYSWFAIRSNFMGFTSQVT